MIEGVFNIDKPAGLTSHDVVNRLRRLTQVRRIGHAGTLDPLATGVLLLSVGRATRLIEYLVGHSKRYQATIRLGQETDSYDAEGEIVAERPFDQVTQSQILDVLSQFKGDVEQLPPLYSAIKKDGQPLYKLARQGTNVQRQPRAVTFYAVEMLAWTPPELTLEVHCSSGTYIRSLAHDIGQALACGGHIVQLRRTAVGDFSIENAVALNHMTAENIGEYCLEMETAVGHLPRLTLSYEQAQELLHGRKILHQGEAAENTLAQIFTEDNQFWGIAIAQSNCWKAKKMLPPVDQK